MTPQHIVEASKWLSDIYSAAAQGKTIQYLGDGVWNDCTYSSDWPTLDEWEDESGDFRIKPEPRRMWEGDGIGCRVWTDSKQEADKWIADGISVAEFVEVIK
jgi:hypothetical protein